MTRYGPNTRVTAGGPSRTGSSMPTSVTSNRLARIAMLGQTTMAARRMCRERPWVAPVARGLSGRWVTGSDIGPIVAGRAGNRQTDVAWQGSGTSPPRGTPAPSSRTHRTGYTAPTTAGGMAPERAPGGMRCEER